jgi:hypothetical protein
LANGKTNEETQLVDALTNMTTWHSRHS